MTDAAPGALRDLRVDGDTLVMMLANDIGAIEAGRRALLDHLASAALSARVVNRIEVVFEEVVSNIVRHGFAPGARHAIRVTAAAEPDVIRLRFEDDGTPFDPLAAAAPAKAASLAETTLGGLGIPLVRRLAVEVSYRPATLTAAPGFQPANDLRVTIARQNG